MNALQAQRVIITDLVRDAIPHASLVNVSIGICVIVSYEVNECVRAHHHDSVRDAMDYWKAEYLLRSCPSVIAFLVEEDDEQIGRISGDGLTDWRDEEYD